MGAERAGTVSNQDSRGAAPGVCALSQTTTTTTPSCRARTSTGLTTTPNGRTPASLMVYSRESRSTCSRSVCEICHRPATSGNSAAMEADSWTNMAIYRRGAVSRSTRAAPVSAGLPACRHRASKHAADIGTSLDELRQPRRPDTLKSLCRAVAICLRLEGFSSSATAGVLARPLRTVQRWTAWHSANAPSAQGGRQLG